MEDVFLVQVILPIAIPKIYSYSVPQEFIPSIQIGQRVEVEFGRTKRYAGLVYSIDEARIDSRQVKPILSILEMDVKLLCFEHGSGDERCCACWSKIG